MEPQRCFSAYELWMQMFLFLDLTFELRPLIHNFLLNFWPDFEPLISDLWPFIQSRFALRLLTRFLILIFNFLLLTFNLQSRQLTNSDSTFDLTFDLRRPTCDFWIHLWLDLWSLTTNFWPLAYGFANRQLLTQLLTWFLTFNLRLKAANLQLLTFNLQLLTKNCVNLWLFPRSLTQLLTSGW